MDELRGAAPVAGDDALLRAVRAHEAIGRALSAGLRAVHARLGQRAAAEAVFRECQRLVGAGTGYVSLLRPDRGQAEIVFVGTGDSPCGIEPGTPMVVRGLLARVLESGRVQYDNSFATSERGQALPPGHVRLENVLFAPLVLDGQPLGLFGLGNKPGGFDERDAETVGYFAEAAGLALAANREVELVDRSEQRFRWIVQGASDAFVGIDADGRVTLWNDGARRLFGCGAEEVAGARFRELFEPGAGPLIDGLLDSLHQLVPDPAPPGWIEIGAIGADGEAFPVELTFVSPGGPPGAPVTAMLRDLRARKSAQRALQESRRLLRISADTAPDIVFQLDGVEGRFEYINRQVQPVLGYTRAEIRAFANGFAGLVHRDDGALLARRGERLDAADDAEVVETELRLRHASGAWRWLQLRETVVSRTAGGRPRQVAGTARDITPQTERDQEYQRLVACIEHAGEMVMITDAGGVIQYVNPALETVTGYARAEIVGLTPRLLKSGRQGPAFYEELWGTITAGQTWHGRFVNRRRDGTLFEEDATISPVRDAGGQIVNYVAVSRDVTRQLAMEAELQRAQRLEAIGRLASGIAHDLKNLMTVALGTTDLLRHRVDKNDAVQDELRVVHQACRDAAELTRALLAFSGRQSLQVDIVDIDRLVAGLQPILERLLPANVAIDVRNTPALGRVRGDRGQLQQVLMNLCLNSRDALPQGGTIRIETSNVVIDEAFAAAHPGCETGPAVQVSVTDDGTGMDGGTLERIFEPFFSTKQPGRGTGLGLSTVFGIVKQHRGAIEVSSAVGAGTAVRISLPRSEVPAEDAALPRPEVARGAETVLILDDHAALRRMVAKVLWRYGYLTIEAGDGLQALELLRKANGAVDLVITDLTMPAMDGREFYGRAREAYPGLRFLFSSASSGEALRDILHDRRTGWIEKPFDNDALARAVRQVLGDADA
ncbi:MAG: PAS domain S-box protein [Acidobacteria bacterium]|nr:PAS domain S-box protein [Acidobacteriota bacterium]